MSAGNKPKTHFPSGFQQVHVGIGNFLVVEQQMIERELFIVVFRRGEIGLSRVAISVASFCKALDWKRCNVSVMS